MSSDLQKKVNRAPTSTFFLYFLAILIPSSSVITITFLHHLTANIISQKHICISFRSRPIPSALPRHRATACTLITPTETDTFKRTGCVFDPLTFIGKPSVFSPSSDLFLISRPPRSETHAIRITWLFVDFWRLTESRHFFQHSVQHVSTRWTRWSHNRRCRTAQCRPCRRR